MSAWVRGRRAEVRGIRASLFPEPNALSLVILADEDDAGRFERCADSFNGARLSRKCPWLRLQALERWQLDLRRVSKILLLSG
jgi:hypothetical protein